MVKEILKLVGKGEIKKRKFGNDKTEERKGGKNGGNNNNDKKSRSRRDMEFGEEKRDLRKDFGMCETFGAETEKGKNENNNNSVEKNNNKDKNNVNGNFESKLTGLEDESTSEDFEEVGKTGIEDNGKLEEKHKVEEEVAS